MALLQLLTPGFFRLRYFDFNDGDPPVVERLPVVAWRISQYEAYPVVPGGEDNLPSEAEEAVLLPDGQVVELTGEVSESEEEWRRTIKRRLERRKGEASKDPPLTPAVG